MNEESLESVTEAEWTELHALETAAGVDSLIEFVPRVTPTWVPPWHLSPIANLFVRAEYEPIRATVSVPPRHGKTELIIHAIPWWLSRHPASHLAYVSYSADLAVAKSRRALDLAKRAEVPLRPDAQRANEWLTPSEGGLKATGIGGGLTGHGADVLIIDDPIKNREEAESSTIRQKTWDWFTSTGLTRVEPGGSVIVVHTRWHTDDLIGRLEREQPNRWEHINLPAISPAGSALWPWRWPVDALDVRHADVGEYDWWALYMGQPRPRGGKLFRDPTYYGRFPDVEGVRILLSCDPAATASTHADHSAIIVAAAKLDARGLPTLDILDVIRLQVEIPVLVGYLLELQKTWQSPIVVEAVGGFKAVPQMLRAVTNGKHLRIIEAPVIGDKFTRALPAAAAWNDGRIRVPQAARWLPEFLDELAKFTGLGDAHDDQTDALAHLFNMFNRLLRPHRNGDDIRNRAPWLPFG